MNGRLLRGLALLALWVSVEVLLRSAGFVVIAHRGASGAAPEHTLAAYDLAVEMGADYIEQDLQLTRDGVLVVLHDDTLDRTANGPLGDCTGPVREKTLAQLRRCEVSSWRTGGTESATTPESDPQRIPTLDEVLGRYGRRTRYYIETKAPDTAPGMEEALLARLAAHDLLPRSPTDHTVLVQSFSADSLQRLRALNDDLPLIQLMARESLPPALEPALRRVAAYAIGIGPFRSDVTRALVTAARKLGLLVHPYTVNSEDEMRVLLDLGVDGMFTDFPDRLIALRNRGD